MTTKSKIVFFAVLAILVAPIAALAGVNPASSGLPSVTLTTGDNNYYNVSATVPGNRVSSMCVACHTRNPGSKTPYRNANGYGYVGSHFVTSTFADTSEGGGYADGSTGKTRAARTAGGIYMADNVSPPNTFNWAGLPRYAYDNAGTPANVVDPQTQAAQMICESCHSIIRNIGPAKLLATGFANGGPTASAAGSTALMGVPGTTTPDLCIGCHGNMEAGYNSEWQYHPVGATPWGGTHHHRNTPGTAVYLGNATVTSLTNMAQMDATDYNEVATNVYQMWAAGPGGLSATARNTDWTSNPSRVKPIFTDNGMIAPRAGNNGVVCTNCHRAHNADSSAGATILMRTTDLTAIRSGTIATDNASAWRGLNRIADVGGRAAAFANTNPLCLGCHR